MWRVVRCSSNQGRSKMKGMNQIKGVLLFSHSSKSLPIEVLGSTVQQHANSDFQLPCGCVWFTLNAYLKTKSVCGKNHEIHPCTKETWLWKQTLRVHFLSNRANSGGNIVKSQCWRDTTMVNGSIHPNLKQSNKDAEPPSPSHAAALRERAYVSLHNLRLHNEN